MNVLFRVRKQIFLLMAIFLAIAAAYQGAGLFYKIDSASVLRHAIFAGIDLFCVYGFLKRPSYFTFFFTIFAVQQYYSHGKYLLGMWLCQREIHWISVIVLVLLPVGLLCLVLDVWQEIVEEHESRCHK